MRYATPTYLILILLWLTACGSSKPHRGTSSVETRTFKTKIVKANFDLRSNDLAPSPHIQYQVRAKCKGGDCTPTLYFFLDSGANTVFLNDRSVSLQAGDEHFYWENRRWQDIRNSPPVKGLITSVKLKQSELQKIAEAKQVSGNLAGESFEWSYKNRAPMRTILRDIDSATGKKH